LSDVLLAKFVDQLQSNGIGNFNQDETVILEDLAQGWDWGQKEQLIN